MCCLAFLPGLRRFVYVKVCMYVCMNVCMYVRHGGGLNAHFLTSFMLFSELPPSDPLTCEQVYVYWNICAYLHINILYMCIYELELLLWSLHEQFMGKLYPLKLLNLSQIDMDKRITGYTNWSENPDLAK